MAWILENVVLLFWQGVVHAMSEGKPWWVWVLWTLAPAFALIILIGLLLLAF